MRYNKWQWDIYKGKDVNKDVNKDKINKDNEIYTKAKQRCKQRQWDI